MDTNILTYGYGKILISIKGVNLVIGDTIYDGISVIARLMSAKELDRFSRIKSESIYDAEIVKDSIFSICVESIVGVTEQHLDTDTFSAGIVTTIADTIIKESLKFVEDPLGKYSEIEASVDVPESMAAVVCRYLNMSYEEALALPIDILFKRFAICCKTFPNELTGLVENEGVEYSKVGDNS